MNNLALYLRIPRAVGQLSQIAVPPSELIDEREFGYTAVYYLWPPSDMADLEIPPPLVRVESSKICPTSFPLWEYKLFYAPEDLRSAFLVPVDTRGLLFAHRRTRPGYKGPDVYVELEKILVHSPCIEEVWNLLPASKGRPGWGLPYPLSLINRPWWTADLLVTEAERYRGLVYSFYRGDEFFFVLQDFLKLWPLVLPLSQQNAGAEIMAHPRIRFYKKHGKSGDYRARFCVIKGAVGGRDCPLIAKRVAPSAIA